MRLQMGSVTADADDEDVLTFRAADGTVLGAGTTEIVAAALLNALSQITHTSGEVDGLPVQGVCMFDHTDTDLVAGLDGDQLALIWRDPWGRVIGRTDLSLEDTPGLVWWLQALVAGGGS